MSLRCGACGHELPARPGLCPNCGAQTRSDPNFLTPLAELRPEAEPPLPAAHEVLRQRTPPLGVAARGTPIKGTPINATPIKGTPTVPGVTRRDPTPMSRKNSPPAAPTDASPAPQAKIVAESRFASAPGPLVDPSAWFEDSQLREAAALPPGPAKLPSSNFRVLTPSAGVRVAAERAPKDDVPSKGNVRRPDAGEFERDRATAPRGRPARPNTPPTGTTAAGMRPGLHVSPALAVEPALPDDSPALVPGPNSWRPILIALLLCVLGGAIVGWMLSSTSGPGADEVRATKPR